MTSWTAFGQPSTQDSVKISRQQQKDCVKWFFEVQVLRDSVIPARDSIILELEQFNDRTEQRLFDTEAKRKQEEDSHGETKDKLKRTRWIGFGSGALGLLGWLIAFVF